MSDRNVKFVEVEVREGLRIVVRGEMLGECEGVANAEIRSKGIHKPGPPNLFGFHGVVHRVAHQQGWQKALLQVNAKKIDTHTLRDQTRLFIIPLVTATPMCPEDLPRCT